MSDTQLQPKKANKQAASKHLSHEFFYWCIFSFLTLVFLGVSLWYIFGSTDIAMPQTTAVTGSQSTKQQSISNIKQYVQDRQPATSSSASNQVINP